MGTELYVGNLAFEVTDDQLMGLFSEVGEVRSAKVVQDRFSGRSKGFGFVEMASEEDVQKAIEKFNQQEFQGRNIRVDRARGGGGGGRGGGGGGRGGRGGYGGGGRGRGRDRDRGGSDY